METKILASGTYHGEYEGKPFDKAVMIYSDDNHWPKMATCSVEVYNRAVEENGGKSLKGTPVKFYYEESYGKFKITKIEPVKEG